MPQRAILSLAVVLLLAASTASATDTVLMSRDWALGMCDAWNEDPGLTEGLAKWMENDKGRGYKILRVYRMDCPDSPQIQLRIADRDGTVSCVESGLKTDEELASSADYVMFAQTERWLEMGAGKYGPMGGMMTGRLKFQGPKWEAMKSMGPFKSFLLLVGKVPGSVDTCPTLPVEESEVVEPPEEMPEEMPEATEIGR